MSHSPKGWMRYLGTKIYFVYQMWMTYKKNLGKRSWLPIFNSCGCHKNVSWSSRVYWWDNLKIDIVKFVAKCPNCQLVKAEHPRTACLTQVIDLSTWKWEYIIMDLVVCLSRSRRQYHFLWLIVDWLKKSATLSASNLLIWWRNMLDCTLMRLWACMRSICPSSFIDVPNSLNSFGGLFKRG